MFRFVLLKNEPGNNDRFVCSVGLRYLYYNCGTTQEANFGYRLHWDECALSLLAIQAAGEAAEFVY